MKRKTIQSFFLAFAASVLVAGCGKAAPASPETVVSDYFKSLLNGDVETFESLQVESGVLEGLGRNNKEQFLSLGKEWKESGVTFSIVDVKVEGDSASVTFEQSRPGANAMTGGLALKKVGENWKVAGKAKE